MTSELSGATIGYQHVRDQEACIQRPVGRASWGRKLHGGNGDSGSVVKEGVREEGVKGEESHKVV